MRIDLITHRLAHLVSRALLLEVELLLASGRWRVTIQSRHAIVSGDDVGELRPVGTESDVYVVVDDALVPDGHVLPARRTCQMGMCMRRALSRTSK